MNLIYVGDSIVDLYPDTVIAINLTRINIGDLSSRFVNYSRTIRVPSTDNNVTLFGFPNNENSISSRLQSTLSGKYVSDGIEVIPNAAILVTGANGKEFDVSIYENVFDFFSLIKGLKLSDINPIAASAWNASAIDSARTNTSGIVSALIYFGTANTYNSSYFLPSFFYHTLVTKVFEFTGLTPSGNILTDARFTDLVVPFFNGKFEYPESYYSQFNDINILGADVPVTNAVNNESVVVSITINNYVHGTFTAFFSVGGITWNGGGNLIGRLRKNGVLVASETIATNPAPGGTCIFQYADFFVPTDSLIMYVYSDDMVAPGIDFTRVNNSYLRFDADGQIDVTLVQWNLLFKNLSCEDLLKDFFNRYAVLFKQTENSLILKTLDAIIADVHLSLDWSNKLVSQDKDFNYNSSFAQSNNFLYNDSISDENKGKGTISIPKTALSLSKTMFTSVFENCQDISFEDRKLAYMPVYNDLSVDGIAAFEDEPGLKLLTLKSVTEEPGIVFNAISRTDYKIAYFIDSLLTKDTGFQYFINQFYSQYSSSLQNMKTVTKFYNLDAIDIANYDPLKMVYDGQGYYLVNKISNFISGKLTKVELFRVK